MVNEQFYTMLAQLLPQADYQAYLQQMEQPMRKGIRINPLKITDVDFQKQFPYPLVKSPFCQHGYYCDLPKGIGYDLYHLLGMFYIQEPSASSVVDLMEIDPEDWVLDLCAAPGSKTTQILEKIQGGLVFSNEFDRKRAQVLKENVIKHGQPNCIVTNTTTKQYAKHMAGLFDKILVDAPCSGEGMFRKEAMAIQQWSMKLVEHCAALQLEILNDAYACLKQDGILMYSTCTLNTVENEGVLSKFMQQHPDMELVKIDVAFGRKGFDDQGYTRRIFLMDGGEGHFMAKLRKKGTSSSTKLKVSSTKIDQNILKQVQKEMEPLPYYWMDQDTLYGGYFAFYAIADLHPILNQVCLGHNHHGRFEFDHHAFMCLGKCFHHSISLDKQQMEQYVHGEQLALTYPKGYYPVSYQNVYAGGVKSDGQALKNKYPKQYRKG